MQRFSSLGDINSKRRNRLQVKNQMRVALPKTKPKFDALIENKQAGASFPCKKLSRKIDIDLEIVLKKKI